MRTSLRVAIVSVLAAACGGDDVVGPDAGVIARPAIPSDTAPCVDGSYWPETLTSTDLPVIVHYQVAADADTAATVLGYLERAWTIETTQLGFRPPVPDGGRCGPDARLDVFLWAGIEESYVDVLGPNPATRYDDQYAYLVIDPWGPYGGPILDTTTAHELNHVFQSADDWSDLPFIYEATAVMIEDEVFDNDDGYLTQVADFAAHPDWSIDRDDEYQTWFMYGAAQYLRFVRDRYFAGDARFVGALWQALRSDPDDEPDALDALDVVLAPRGASFRASVAEFARWRVYTGDRADDAHLEEAAAMAPPARVAVVRATGATVPIEPMVNGAAFVDLDHQAGDPTAVTVDLVGADPRVAWTVQVVPGTTSDGDTLDLRAGPVTVALARDRTLVVTAVAAGTVDADDRTDARYRAQLVIAPTGS